MTSLGLVMENSQVLPAFLLCSTLLVIKMYAVAVITGQVRLRKKVRALVGVGREEKEISTLLAFPCKKVWGLKNVTEMLSRRTVGAVSRLLPPQPFWKLAWPSASWYESTPGGGVEEWGGFPREWSTRTLTARGLRTWQFPRQARRFHIWVEPTKQEPKKAFRGNSHSPCTPHTLVAPSSLEGL